MPARDVEVNMNIVVRGKVCRVNKVEVVGNRVKVYTNQGNFTFGFNETLEVD
jgi:hypothetical protein